MCEDEKKKADIDEDDPYVYVDGKKEFKDGSGMVKESWIPVDGKKELTSSVGLKQTDS